MKVLTDFHIIKAIFRAFYDFTFVYKHSQSWRPKCIAEIVLINNLGFKVLMVTLELNILSNMRTDIK